MRCFTLFVDQSDCELSYTTSGFVTDTSFAPCRGDKGHIVLSTKPKILFCDLRLSPGESKSCMYHYNFKHLYVKNIHIKFQTMYNKNAIRHPLQK